MGADVRVARVKIWAQSTRISNSIVSIIDSQGTTQYSYRIGTGQLFFEFLSVNPGNLCDQLLQQFHRVDEELSIQGKWQGGSVTGVCRGWGTNKVRSIVHYSLGRYMGDHRTKCAHVALSLCIQFLSLQSMYHIVDATRKIDSEKNEIAIMNVFEEFIGCALSID